MQFAYKGGLSAVVSAGSRTIEAVDNAIDKLIDDELEVYRGVAPPPRSVAERLPSKSETGHMQKLLSTSHSFSTMIICHWIPNQAQLSLLFD